MVDNDQIILSFERKEQVVAVLTTNKGETHYQVAEATINSPKGENVSKQIDIAGAVTAVMGTTRNARKAIRRLHERMPIEQAFENPGTEWIPDRVNEDLKDRDFVSRTAISTVMSYAPNPKLPSDPYFYFE